MRLKKMSLKRRTIPLLWCGMAVLFFSFSGHGYASENRLAEIQQQARTITGHVAEANGDPLIGVNVLEEGTSNGTVTDFDGNFTLTLTTAQPVLTFLYVGFENQSVPVGTRSVINVVMEEESSFLDEVVVIGYGTARRGDLTGAIATVRTEDLQREAPRSVQDLLRGNAAGLNIGFGTSSRGTSSLLVRGDNRLLTQAQRDAGRTSEPLIVLDGVIFQGDLSDINPNDILSINILKDASSAAVYGARAANGVIAIVTQRGARGNAPRINFNGSVGLVEVGRRSEMMNEQEFGAFRAAYKFRTEGVTHSQFYSDPRRLTDGLSQLAWFNYNRATPATSVTQEELLAAYGQRLGLSIPEIDNLLKGRTTNWADEIFRQGLQQDYNVSVANRTENSSYFWSMGYSDRQGFTVGDETRIFRSRLNLETTITPFLRVGMNTNFAARDEGNVGLSGLDGNPGWMQLHNMTPYMVNHIGDTSIEEILWREPSRNGNVIINPLYQRMHINRRDWRNNFDANLFAILSLPFNIEYQVNFIPNYRWRERFNHNSSTAVNWSASGGSAEREHWKTYGWQVDNIVRWNQRFADIHQFDVTLLANAEKNQSFSTRAAGSQFSPSDILGFHNIGAAANATHAVSSEDQVFTADALMGRVSYSLMDRYMLTYTIRRDGYSAFGLMNPRGTFMSVAAGWTFTSEEFAQSFNHILDFGRLRLSWGENGNRDVGIYAALADLTTGLGPIPGVSNGSFIYMNQLRVGRMSNAAMQWERTAATNLGLDFSLFNNLISGSFEGYISTTTDLLMSRRLPSLTGFTSVTANLGRLENKGFEATLNYNVIQNQNFAWTTSGNFALNRRKLLSIYGDMENIYDDNGVVIGQRERNDPNNNWFIGEDPDRFWHYELAGVWQLHEAEEAARYGRRPGDFKFVDQNGDGVMDSDDRIHQGYSTPRFTWSWRNEFTVYRDFSVSMMMYSHWGHSRSFNRAANNTFPQFISQYKQPFWTPENPINNYAAVGSLRSGEAENIYRKASFIRLDNVTLSYNVPRSFLQKVSVQNMRISASVRNPLVWAPEWTLWDPETNAPTPRTYSVSLNFTL